MELPKLFWNNAYLREEKVHNEEHHHTGTNENNVESVANVCKCRGGNRCPKNGAEEKAFHGESNALSPKLRRENFRGINKRCRLNPDSVAIMYAIRILLEKHIGGEALHNDNPEDEKHSGLVSSSFRTSVKFGKNSCSKDPIVTAA